MKYLFVLFIPFYLYPQITLRDTTNQYDYIIITAPEFISTCEQFKEHKETVRGFNVLLVDTIQIYNEFNSDSTGQANIRSFISYAGEFWQNPKPKFILIVGSVHQVPNFNILTSPNYYSPYYQSDYYYSQNIYESDTIATDFFVGRIPCKNTTELQNYFNKAIDYETDQMVGGWTNTNLFICEDDPPYDFLDAGLSIASYLPENIYSKIIFETDTSDYFGDKDSILNFINYHGCSVVWFEGQSADSSLINEDYFNLADVQKLHNESKYFISIIPTVNSAIIDSNSNIVNEMLFLKNAGSIGGVLMTGPVYWGIINDFQHHWAEQLYDDFFNSIVESLNLNNVSAAGLYYLQRIVTNYWGDPSLKLKYDETTDVKTVELKVPLGFNLNQNYPNPFNPNTSISYSIPENAFVTLKIYDVLGNEVEVLINEQKESGNYQIDFNASELSSGIYYYTLTAGNFTSTKKMSLIK